MTEEVRGLSRLPGCFSPMMFVDALLVLSTCGFSYLISLLLFRFDCPRIVDPSRPTIRELRLRTSMAAHNLWQNEPPKGYARDIAAMSQVRQISR